MGFPIAAEIGDKHIVGNVSYEWNGYAWDAVATAGAVAVTKYEHTATDGQTVFAAAGYRSKKYVDVYINGMKLSDTDFTASDETTVVLNVGAAVGDLVVIEVSDAVIMADIIKTVGVTTLASGAAATVGYVDGALEFGIPVGPQGIQGIQGLQGTQGLKGDTGDVTLEQLNTKQDTLVSGTNIKTIGGASILGDGDMVVGGATDYQEFTTSGTWTKPAGINYVYVEAIGGGAGACPTTGGGGGAFNSKVILASSLSLTVTITVGAGGTGTATGNTTTAGGNSTFGGYLTAHGGYGGNFLSPFTLGMGGGGEAMSTINTNGGSSGGFSSGAGGYSNGVRAGNCIKGGAGGSGYNGSVYSPAGVSTDGGNGGANGANGSVPGGGGSAKDTTGANGANGRVRIWAW